MKIKIICFIIMSVFFSACSDSIKSHFNRGKKLSKAYKEDRAEKWEQAIKEYDIVIKMKVDAREYQANLYRKLGKYHMQMDHWNDALENYLKAKEILPNEGLVHYRLGLCYSQLSRSAENKAQQEELIRKAEESYQMALKLNPALIDPLYGLGIIYFLVYKEYNKGIKYMGEVLTRDPKNIDARFALARFYYEMGELGPSLDFYKSLLNIVPERDQRYQQVKDNIARILKEMGAQ